MGIFSGFDAGYDPLAWDRIFLGWELFAHTLPPSTVQAIRALSSKPSEGAFGPEGRPDWTREQKVRWSEHHYVNGFPDFTAFDDTDATRDPESEATERDEAALHYYDLLDQRR